MTSAEACLLLNRFGESMEKIRCTAMMLRTEILSIPFSNPPSPMSVHTLKTSYMIPEIIVLLFLTLFSGLGTLDAQASDVVQRKALASASDSMFNCTRGRLRPWKHNELGLGLSTLTGSKTVLNILNRVGHCISYDDVKRLETEMAYSCCEGDRETPAGLNLCDGLSTGNFIYIYFDCK